MPKPPKPQPMPSVSVQATYTPRRTSAEMGKMNRPSRFYNPALGMSKIYSGRPSLLGGS